MQIEIKLDENCKEPKIIVVTNKMTDEINEIRFGKYALFIYIYL